MRLSTALNPVTAAWALAFSIFARVTNNGARSTNAPMAEALRAPLIRSSSQCPGSSRSSTSAGRSWMLVMLGMTLCRSSPRARGRRLLRDCRGQATSSPRNSPRGMT
jgi:hypothetical protein